MPLRAVSADEQSAHVSQKTLRQQESVPYVDVDISAYDLTMPVMHRGTAHKGMAFDAEVEDYHWKYMEMMEKERADPTEKVSISN